MNKKILAFDFGASSGRAMLSYIQNEKLVMQEIHRFSNDPVLINGTLHWDILRLFFEIKQAIVKAMQMGGFDAIGIDTWAVDFGLLDKQGNLIENPVHYRDERTVGMMEKAFEIVPKSEIYLKTGIQFMRFNTIYQLLYLKQQKLDLFGRVDKFLMIPDLFAYFLTGVKKAEYTNASTTQLFNPISGRWDNDLITKLGISTEIFPEIIDAGSAYGMLKDEICKELNCPKVPVIAVATHDTGSAVVSVPSINEKFAYISCGTWSLLGTELKKPLISNESLLINFTNEGGFNRTTRYIKNIMGLWLIQESRRQWQREGYDLTFNQLDDLANETMPFACFINPDCADFETPGDIPKRIQEFCKRTNQYVPKTIGEITRCIYESLAMKYAFALNSMENAVGYSFEEIHLIGGGIKGEILCNMTANATAKKVLAGPVEATVIGNIAVQMISLGEISDIIEARKMILNSENIKEYVPENSQSWKLNYNKFTKILEN